MNHIQTKKPQVLHRYTAVSFVVSTLMGLSINSAYSADIIGDTVTTNLTVRGDRIILNNNTTNSSQLRFNSTTKLTSFWLNAPGEWVWSHGATPIDVMSLEANNVLSLYDLRPANSIPTIILNPGNSGVTPAITPSISVGGNLVLTTSNAQSILNSQGYLRVSGGVLNVPSTAFSISSLTVAGGLGVARDSWVNGIRIGKGGGNIASNTGVGYGTLDSNISGGESNSAFGFEALFGNINGSGNTATGHLSLRMNAYGWYNTSIGSQSLRNQLNGSRNVAVGFDAGSLVENGSGLSDANDCIFIGTRTRAKLNSSQNSIVIGANALGRGSNTTVIGNDSTQSTHLRGETNVAALRITGKVVIEQLQGDISMGNYR